VKVRYQVFVSSTFEDLRDTRESVIKAILELGHIPVGMEMFSAGDEQQWELIKRQIDDSDYYVVIVAHRYGSMDGANSYTEKEYDYAAEIGVPSLGFVIDPTAEWPANHMDRDSTKTILLEKFKEKVKNKIVSFWKNPEDLHAKVSIALAKAVTAYPRIGWVRSSTSVTPEVTNELSRLSKENADLRIRLTQLESKDSQSILNQQAETIEILGKNKFNIGLKFKGETSFGHAVEATLYEIFTIIAQETLIEISVKWFCTYLAFCLKENEEKLESPYPMAANVARQILSSFQALGIMQPSTKRHAVGDKEEYWQITQSGRDLHHATIKQSLLKGGVFGSALKTNRPTL